MKVVNKLYYVFFCLALLTSCGPEPLSEGELIKWMENPENNLRLTKKEGPVTYILQYKNVDYVLSQKKGIIGEDGLDINDLSDELSNNLLFDLFITCENGTASPLQYRSMNEQEINQRFYYYQFKFINDIHLEVNEEKIAPLYCIADKGSGLNNTMAFSIGFEKNKIENTDFKLVVNDIYLGSGTVKFLYKEKYLQDIPELKQ